jgi:hypothetical protein
MVRTTLGTTGEGFVGSVAEPIGFVAVTRASTREPISAALTRRRAPEAPAMTVQRLPQRGHA